jgi:streptogramin lyase
MVFTNWRHRTRRSFQRPARRTGTHRPTRFRPELIQLEDRCVLSPVINEFPIPTAGSPLAITTGPDGNLWFTESGGDAIGRITPGGAVTVFNVATGRDFLNGIALGADNNLWFTEELTNRIGRITPSGTLTQYAIPTPNSRPIQITAGPDGNLWFAESFGNQIGRITTAGVITEFPLPTPSALPEGITIGPDGNLWFTETNINHIGRISPAGAVTEFPIQSFTSGPFGITSGPDGNLWFTQTIFDSLVQNQIGRITPTGTITLFTIPTFGAGPADITTGSDGNLWFTEQAPSQIGQITPAGVFSEFPVPTGRSQPYGITSGPDGNLWFTEALANKIGQIVLQPTPPPVGSTNQGFVLELYQDLLRRQADPGGLSFWTGALNQGQLTRIQVVQNFLASPEYRTDVVKGLYHVLLGRSADPVGLGTWTTFLAQGGTGEQVVAQLLASDEYFSSRGGGTANGFLAAVYQDVLARTIDPAGSQTWGQVLAGGASRLSVVAGILASTEAIQDQVEMLYLQFLHRNADPSGLSNSTSFLQSAGLGLAVPSPTGPFFIGKGVTPSVGVAFAGGAPPSLEQLIVALASSPEYFGQMGS